MRYLRIILAIIFIMVINHDTEAQFFVDKEEPDPKFAEFCMKFHNYHDAQLEYERLIKKDSTNIEYKHNLGLCHLNLNRDKSKSIHYFKWVLKQDEYPKQAWYDLGKAYQSQMDFGKAVIAYTNFINSNTEDTNTISAHRQLEMIENAKNFIANPENVKIVNLGEYVNTPFPEYNPYVTANERMLVYYAQRKRNLGTYRYDDGYFAADIYNSYFRFGSWRRARRMNSLVNSKNIERVVSMEPNGSKILVHSMEKISRKNSLLVFTKRGRHFRDNEFIVKNANLPYLSACYSPDKRRLYFSMKNEEKNSGLDIYYRELLPNGNWSEEVILDSVVSTEYDDTAPYFSPDGKFFYFSSKGYNSMGGFDLFKANYNKKTKQISNIKNLGYPVNTVNNDITISTNESGRYAYISSLRKEGVGDYDIYRVVFKDVQPTYTIVKGGIFNRDSISFKEELEIINDSINRINQPLIDKYERLISEKKDTASANKILAQIIPNQLINVDIKVVNKDENKEYGEFEVKESTANYTVLLPPGKWDVIFSREGYKDVVISDIKIEERDLRHKFINKHILFKK